LVALEMEMLDSIDRSLKSTALGPADGTVQT